MDDNSRLSKQIWIAVIFIMILAGIGFGIYKWVSPAKPMPTPNLLADLDPIQILSSNLFNVRNNDYDFMARVYNPNLLYGAVNVDYAVSFYNSMGQPIGDKNGNFYILPGQTKYIINSPLSFSEPAFSAEVKINSVEWQEVDKLAASGVTLLIRSGNYGQINQPNLFSKVGGDIFNGSDFDLNDVDIALVLLDKDNNPLAAGKTEIKTFLAKTTRGFEVSWVAPFVGQVFRVDAEATTNIFENLNFLRRYGGHEKFKQLY